jgi:hypothetical protein
MILSTKNGGHLRKPRNPNGAHIVRYDEFAARSEQLKGYKNAEKRESAKRNSDRARSTRRNEAKRRITIIERVIQPINAELGTPLSDTVRQRDDILKESNYNLDHVVDEILESSITLWKLRAPYFRALVDAFWYQLHKDSTS